MLYAYEAILENGKLTWLDTPPNLEKQKVEVLILPKKQEIDKGVYDPNKKGENG